MTEEIPLLSLFGEHFKELRRRVMVCFISVLILSGAAYFHARPISVFLMRPIFAAAPELSNLVYTHLTEAFISYLKIAVLFGISGSFPVFLFQIWRFVAPGLSRREKRTALVITGWATLLFSGGIFFAYGVAIPRILAFLMDHHGPDLLAMPRLDLYLTFVARTALAFGLAFEIPFLMVAAGRSGLVAPGYFTEKRWFSYGGILVLAFLLTAGEIMGALMLSVPLFILYESGIILCRFAGAGRRKEPAA